jgi:hypothetical protein
MASQKRESHGRQPLLLVRARQASASEAEGTARALERLLAELVRQVRATGRKKDDSEQHQP